MPTRIPSGELALPVGPLSVYVEELVAVYGHDEVSSRSGVSRWTLANIRSGRHQRVSLHVVDQLMIAYGRHPAELYPEYWDECP